jgi:serine/threonine protein kinase
MEAGGEATREWIGRVLGGQFRLQQPLGRGGMGHVYLAEQLEIGRPVVVKLLNAQALSGSSGEARFKREAQALAQLNHPNIVQLYAFGRCDDGTPYLAMEYIAGRTLGDLVAQRGALPEHEVREILDQLCDALIDAHHHGVIHRDLKPDNVMISTTHTGRVKILDFGIAKLTRASAPRITQNGEILGTPQYMAPEQLSEHATDERTDIYALGLIGYELLTGEVPFEADTALSLMMKVLNEPIVPPRLKAPEREVSREFDALITRCLEKSAERRFQSALELREALAALHENPQPLAAGSGHVLAGRDHPSPLAAANPMSLSLDVQADVFAQRYRAPRRSHRLWIIWTLALGVGAVSALYFGDQLTWPASESPSGETAQVQWIQGIPFPAGARYPSFEEQFIEAHVAASPESVITFYQTQLAKRWSGYHALPQGLMFNDASAPIEQLTVTPLDDDSGSRIIITRRPRSD